VAGQNKRTSNSKRRKNSSKKNKFPSKKKRVGVVVKKTKKNQVLGFFQKKSARKKGLKNKSKNSLLNKKNNYFYFLLYPAFDRAFFYEISKVWCGFFMFLQVVMGWFFAPINILTKHFDFSKKTKKQKTVFPPPKIRFQKKLQSYFNFMFSKKPKKRGRKRKWSRTWKRFSYYWAVRYRKFWRAVKKKRVAFIRRIKVALGLQRGKGRPRKKPKNIFLRILSSIFEEVPHKPQPKPKKLKKPRKIQPERPSFPWRALSSFITSALILGGSWWMYDFLFVDLPSPLDLVKKDQIVTTKILDRHGNLLYRIYEDENRTIVPLSKVSPDLIDATIAIEDKDFYDHHGFSIAGIARAAWENMGSTDGSIQGGSTITQQLVKNRLLTPERTLKRKVRELILSVLVEGTFTKEEILEMYLNQVAYGGSTYGVEEASWRYFNKPASQLSLAESALLAGLPQAPSLYTPFGSNPELSYARQEDVLRRMREDGYITREEFVAAKAEELVFDQDVIDIEAPHFVMYVKKILAERFGEDVLYQGGLEVRTTLDLELQREVQDIVTEEVESLARLRVNNGAALVTNPQTGEILSMVGSKDYFDFSHDGQVNVVLRPRQPGSSIKPLTYAVSMEKGKSPSSILQDTPITYSTVGSPPYSPQNYDGKFHGNVTLREALASSYNVPAVKELAGIGVNNLIKKGESLGITTWKDTNRFGLSLTLGGGEVRMIDMAQLYSTFANYGYPVEPNPLLEIRDYKGELYYRNDCALDKKNCLSSRELDSRVAYLISDILSDNQARSPAFGFHSVLDIPGQEVAVKTGTTNSLRDNWTIGYTTDRLTAVWVGNNDNTSMSYVASGITGASPIWNNIMRLLLDEENPHQFDLPAGLTRVRICSQTGTLPCTGCPLVKEEVFIKGAEPKAACNPVVFLKPTPTPTP
jgi:1A family penicillin-binding protein